MELRQSGYFRYLGAANTHMQKLAYAAVQRAITSGELVRPGECQDCHRHTRRIISHHEDYARPLDVAWVCGGCHKERHRPKFRPTHQIVITLAETANTELLRACAGAGVSRQKFVAGIVVEYLRNHLQGVSPNA